MTTRRTDAVRPARGERPRAARPAWAVECTSHYRQGQLAGLLEGERATRPGAATPPAPPTPQAGATRVLRRRAPDRTPKRREPSAPDSPESAPSPATPRPPRAPVARSKSPQPAPTEHLDSAGPTVQHASGVRRWLSTNARGVGLLAASLCVVAASLHAATTSRAPRSTPRESEQASDPAPTTSGHLAARPDRPEAPSTADPHPDGERTVAAAGAAPTPARDAHPAPSSVPPSTPARATPADAARALARGELTSALAAYRQLERAAPHDPAYPIVTGVLTRKLAARCRESPDQEGPCAP